MTVSELIAKLQALPGDMPVLTYDRFEDPCDLDEPEIEDVLFDAESGTYFCASGYSDAMHKRKRSELAAMKACFLL